MRASSSSTASPETSARPLPRAWTIVAILWAAFVLNYVDRQVVFSIFPVLRAELGFTNAQLGLVGSIFIWVYSLCCPLVGRLADLVRREVLIVASLVLWSLATLGTGFAAGVGSFLIWRAVMGVTEALFAPAAISVIGTVHPGATRSRALAVYGCGQMTGIIAGAWYGGWIADVWGWRRGFVLLAIAGIAFAPVLRRVLGKLPGVEPTLAAASRPREIFRSRCYWALTAAFFMLMILLWMLYAWLPNFIHERYRLSMADSGFNATAYLQSMTVIGLLAGGALADALSQRVPAARYYMAASGLLLAAPFAWLTFATGSLAVLKMSSAGFGLFAGCMIANVFASAYDVMSPANYGLGAGTLNMIGGLSGGCAVFLAGQWKDTLGIEGLMGWSAAAACVAALSLAAVAARHFHPDRQRAGIAAAAGPMATIN